MEDGGKQGCPPRHTFGCQRQHAPREQDDTVFEFFDMAVNLNPVDTEVISGIVSSSVRKASFHQLLLSLKQSLEMSAVGR